MKMLKFLMVPLLALQLAACGTTGGIDFSSIGSLVNTVTTGVPNPVTVKTIYQIKQGYAASLSLMNSYRKYCYETDYDTLMADSVRKPICQNRRGVIRGMQRAEANAKAAISDLVNFSDQHPTLDASALISAATTAVSAFRASAPAVGQ